MFSSTPYPLATALLPTTPEVARAATDETGRRRAGIASLAQGLLLFVPLVVLGGAIGWPASLGDPAASMLPSLSANEGAVRFGYLAYLGYSLLFGVTMILLLRRVEGHLSPAARRVAVGFAIASVVARCLGIVRWLVPMPALAETWETAGPAQRETIDVVYAAIDAYGGTVGEALGVGLFAAVSLAVLAAGMLRERAVPRVVAAGAAVAAAALALSAAELAGVDLGPLLTVAVTVVQIWFIATGVWLLRTPRTAGTLMRRAAR